MEFCNYLFSNIHKLHKETKSVLPIQVLGAGYEKITFGTYYWDNKSLREDKEYLILQYTLDGTGHFEYVRNGERKKLRIAKDTMFVISSDMEYKYWHEAADPAWTIYWIMLKGPYARTISRVIRKSGPIFQIGSDSPVIQLLSGLLARLNDRFFIDTYSLSTFGYEFLTQFYKFVSRTGVSPGNPSAYDFIYQVQSFIRVNLINSKKINLQQLADHFGYNKIYFNSFFKKKTGITPHQYILDYKIKHAAFLLCATHRKIRIVARDSGFENENYFSKVFKKHLGKTPERYRLENKASYPSEEFLIL